MEGRRSASDGRATPPPGDPLTDPELRRWANLRDLYLKLRVAPVVQRVRAFLWSPTSPAPDSFDEPFLSRLPVYNDIVLGSPMSIQEELMLTKHLETVLLQVQCAVRGMNLQPVQLSDAEDVRVVPRRPQPSYSSPWKRLGYSLDSTRVLKADSQALQKEEIDQKIALIEKYSREIKTEISLGILHNYTTEEHGRRIYSMVDCMEKNLIVAMKSGGSSFSFNGLMKMIKVPDGAKKSADKLVQRVTKYFTFAEVAITLAGSAADVVGTSPLHFGAIGTETSSILNQDFTFEKLKLLSYPDGLISAGIGSQKWGGHYVRQLMMKLKHNNCSFSCNLRSLVIVPDANAVPNANAANAQILDVAEVRFSRDKLMGYNLKTMVRMPYPSLRGEFAIRAFNPYVHYGSSVQLIPNPGEVGMNPSPVLGIYGVLGVKNTGIGLQIQYNSAQNQFIPAVGVFLRSEIFAGSLKYKHRPSVYSASFVKKIVDTSASVAFHGSFTHGDEVAANNGPRFNVGLKNYIDPTCYYKARIGTPGASLAVKKSTSSGMCTVKGLVHFDFNEHWNVPKLGIMFSFRGPTPDSSS